LFLLLCGVGQDYCANHAIESTQVEEATRRSLVERPLPPPPVPTRPASRSGGASGGADTSPPLPSCPLDYETPVDAHRGNGGMPHGRSVLAKAATAGGLLAQTAQVKEALGLDSGLPVVS